MIIIVFIINNNDDNTNNNHANNHDSHDNVQMLCSPWWARNLHDDKSQVVNSRLVLYWDCSPFRTSMFSRLGQRWVISIWLAEDFNHDRSQAFILLPMLSCNSRALGNIPTLKWGHAQATWMLLAWAMFQEWPTMCTLHRATNKTFMVNNAERLTLLKYAVEADCSKEMPTHRMRSACCTSSSMMSNTSSGVITSSASAHADHG